LSRTTGLRSQIEPVLSPQPPDLLTVIHAEDDEAKAFCEHFDFEPSLTDAHSLFLLRKDLQRLAK
jgi:hypothetical protein